MRNISLQFGNIRVLIRVVKRDQLRVTVDGKHYLMSRKGKPTFTDPIDDLSEELQAKIFWAVENYFPRRK